MLPYNTCSFWPCAESFMYILFTSKIINSLWNQLCIFLIFVNQVDLLRYNFLFLTVLFLVSKNEMVTSPLPCLLNVSQSKRFSVILSQKVERIYMPIQSFNLCLHGLAKLAERLGLCFSCDGMSTRQRGWKHKMSFSPQIVLPSWESDRYFGTALLGASGSHSLFNVQKSQGVRQWHVITVCESWALKRKRGGSDGKSCTSYFYCSVLRQENHLLQLELWKKARRQKAEVSVWLISEYYLIFYCIENKGMFYQNILSDFHLLGFWKFYPLAL